MWSDTVAGPEYAELLQVSRVDRGFQPGGSSPGIPARGFQPGVQDTETGNTLAGQDTAVRVGGLGHGGWGVRTAIWARVGQDPACGLVCRTAQSMCGRGSVAGWSA